MVGLSQSPRREFWEKKTERKRRHSSWPFGAGVLQKWSNWIVTMPSLTIQTIVNRGTVVIKNPNASPITIETPPAPHCYAQDRPADFFHPTHLPKFTTALTTSDLLQWVETFTAQRARLVYDSSVHGLGGNQLWPHISGLARAAFVFKAQGNVFGSYHSVLPEAQGVWVDEDPEHFVFTVKNPFNVAPTRFDQRRPIDDGVLFVSKSSSELMNIGYLCFLASGAGSFIRLPQSGCPFSFSKGYTDHTNIGDVIFTGSTHPTLFELDQVLAFDLSDGQ